VRKTLSSAALAEVAQGLKAQQPAGYVL